MFRDGITSVSSRHSSFGDNRGCGAQVQSEGWFWGTTCILEDLAHAPTPAGLPSLPAGATAPGEAVQRWWNRARGRKDTCQAGCGRLEVASSKEGPSEKLGCTGAVLETRLQGPTGCAYGSRVPARQGVHVLLSVCLREVLEVWFYQNTSRLESDCCGGGYIFMRFFTGCLLYFS